jgi:isocitrate dehydrogenase (NAD+)
MPQESHTALAHFQSILAAQLARVERLRAAPPPVDLAARDPLVVGVCTGDGIGPILCRETLRVLRALLAAEIAAGQIELRLIEGLTIENRAAHRAAIPADVLAEIKACDVVLKAPTTTPEAGSPWPNLESANVAMRRELDLFANVRPVRVPKLGIDWVFFRENTEGPYILGSAGLRVGDLALDFSAVTRQGSERLLRLAFLEARRRGADRVVGVTKANVIKATDGLFLEVGAAVARDFPGIRFESWYADIVAAKLIDPKRRADFAVFALPNLYGDILTDEAAEIQGGVGTAGSANLGWRHAMFEAIHGSAPRMVDEGRGEYADPSSLMRAAAMLLRHVGRAAWARRLDEALDHCLLSDPRVMVTGRPDGATAAAFTDRILAVLDTGAPAPAPADPGAGI